MDRVVRIIPVAGLAALLVLGAQTLAMESPPSQPASKAYKVSVFDKPRQDPSRKQVAEGLFVFAERRVAFEEVPETLREEFMSRYREIFFSTEVDPNGCFALRHLGSEHGSVAVLAPYGLVGWQHSAPDVMTGRLFQSPDSLYDLTLTMKDDRFEGTGNGNLGFRSGATLVEHFYGERVPMGRLADCFQEASEIRQAGKESPK
ncbi:MAG: hypothetical protein AB1451_01440 [Nitrospirota bacterium]